MVRNKETSNDVPEALTIQIKCSFGRKLAILYPHPQPFSSIHDPALSNYALKNTLNRYPCTKKTAVVPCCLAFYVCFFDFCICSVRRGQKNTPMSTV